ncbi:MAG: hypothetical protein CL916_00130 [Deltaproteobacteria bacterium]|nr:hypothetical protein [Deltaproteobacteria bacterium]
MQTFEDYKKFRDESVSLLRDLAQKLRVLGGESKARTIIQVAEELNKNDFRIIFCGEFKRGKSTLINAILGQKALPMKVAPCTGVITEVKYSPEPKALVHPLRGDPFKASHEDIKKYIAIQGNDAPDVSRVELCYPINICENAITLIDSPGLNEDWKRTQVSLTELNKADAVIMVLSCEMALSRSEMDFIESRLMHHNAGSFFVWNRYDAVWNDDQEIAALRSRSQSRLQKYKNQVYYLSAREALVARLRNDHPRYTRSGLPSFMNSLEQFLTEKRAVDKLYIPLNQGKRAAQYAIHVLGPRLKKLINNTREELQKESLYLREKLKEISHTKEALKELIKENIEDILNDIIETMDDFLITISQKACQDSGEITLPKAANRQERQDFLIRWYNQWLKEQLQSLGSEEFLKHIHNGFEELSQELHHEREKFHTHIQQLLGIDIRTQKTMNVDHIWTRDISYFVSSSIATRIHSSCIKPVSVSMMGLGALRAWLAGEKIDEAERITFATALFDTLQNKRSDIIRLIRHQLEESFSSIRASIDGEMQELIHDAQHQIHHAIELHSKQESISDIEEALHNIKTLYIELSERAEDA